MQVRRSLQETDVIARGCVGGNFSLRTSTQGTAAYLARNVHSSWRASLGPVTLFPDPVLNGYTVVNRGLSRSKTVSPELTSLAIRSMHLSLTLLPQTTSQRTRDSSSRSDADHNLTLPCCNLYDETDYGSPPFHPCRSAQRESRLLSFLLSSDDACNSAFPCSTQPVRLNSSRLLLH